MYQTEMSRNKKINLEENMNYYGSIRRCAVFIPLGHVAIIKHTKISCTKNKISETSWFTVALSFWDCLKRPHNFLVYSTCIYLESTQLWLFSGMALKGPTLQNVGFIFDSLPESIGSQSCDHCKGQLL